MTTKTIRVNCTSTHQISHHKLKIIQGDSKDLMGENYLKYKKSLIKHGIMKPANVWINEDGVHCILDGTQLVRSLTALENEGFDVPEIPITLVEASSLKDAKDKIVSLMSSFGTINNQGFLEFAMDLPYSDLGMLSKEISIPGLDLEKVADEFTKDHTDKKNTLKKIECPHCGEEFEK